jgi:hypothetical protein
VTVYSGHCRCLLNNGNLQWHDQPTTVSDDGAARSFRKIFSDETALSVSAFKRPYLSTHADSQKKGLQDLNTTFSTTNFIMPNPSIPQFDSGAPKYQEREVCQMISPNFREFCKTNLPGLMISDPVLIWLQRCVLDIRNQNLNVYCIEPVMRKDLLEALLNRADLFDNESLPAEHSSPSPTTVGRVVLTFHGTRSANIASIIKHGFRVPAVSLDETGQVHRSTTGSTFGRGIYCTPDFNIARLHGYDTNILICAVTLGKVHYCTTNIGTYVRSGLVPGFNSHISHEMKEWVVFQPDQIIPLFVLHLNQHQPSIKLSAYAQSCLEGSRYWKDCRDWQDYMCSQKAYVSSISESEVMDMTNPQKFRFKSFRNG